MCISNKIGPPVEGDDFYGRENELKKATRLLDSGHSLTDSGFITWNRFKSVPLWIRLILIATLPGWKGWWLTASSYERMVRHQEEVYTQLVIHCSNCGYELSSLGRPDEWYHCTSSKCLRFGQKLRTVHNFLVDVNWLSVTQVSQVITYSCPEGCAACET